MSDPAPPAPTAPPVDPADVPEPSQPQSKAKWALFAVIATVLTVADQVTKVWVQQNIALYRQEIPVIPGFFSLIHAENTGAAFSFLADFEYRMWVFAAFTVFAVGMLLQMLWQLPNDDRFQTIALGVVFSGAVGNAIDRAVKQSVTDFAQLYTEHPGASAFLSSVGIPNPWPSFNVADVAIVVGLGMFLIHWLFLEKDEKDAKPGTAPSTPAGA